MATWSEQYLAALTARDAVEKANQHVYDAYTRLADRIGQSQRQGHTGSRTQLGQGKNAGAGAGANAIGARETPIPPPPPPPPGTSAAATTTTTVTDDAMRSDLAEAQKSRLQLRSQLTQLTSETASLRALIQANEAKIASLQRDRTTLSRRLRDRDEELKMKAKLLDDVQCEVVSLDLQLNMAEEKAEKLRGENEELVRRWMERVRVEAEAMNKDMEF